MRPFLTLALCTVAALACDGDGPTAPRLTRGIEPCTADTTMPAGWGSTGCVEVDVEVLDANGDRVLRPSVHAPLIDANPFFRDTVELGASGRVFLRLRYYGVDSLRASPVRMLTVRTTLPSSPSQGGYVPAVTDSVRIPVTVARVGSRPYRYSFAIRTNWVP